MDEVARASEVARVAAERTTELVACVRDLNHDELLAPSALPEWNRLAIICHLRYGVTAILRMSRDALAGRETSYYPAGRARQRPTTLTPAPTEAPEDVIEDWERVANALDDEWALLDQSRWATEVIEPRDNPDLGTIPLARLALGRLTELDVHGTDLEIGFPDWSKALVEVALPTRLGWLSTRRTNHRRFDQSIRGSWLLAPNDGPSWIVSVDRERVDSRVADESRDLPNAVIAGSSRDLLALLLGRPRTRDLEITGDLRFGQSFDQAFPGP